jgi:hypothetical protein
MFDAHSRQTNVTPYDGSEASDDAAQTGRETDSDATTFDRSTNIEAERPRFLCVGFAVIRI